MSETTPKSLYLFYGENTFASYKKLKFWKEEFIKKYDENSLEIIEGKNLDPAEFTTNIEAIPFLSEKRLMIVKDFLSQRKSEDQKRIAEHLDRTSEFCIILFYETEIPDKRSSLYKKIQKIGKIEEFRALSPNELSKWILDQAKERSIKINYANANYLGEHCGANLWTLENELGKLKSYALEKEISKEDIELNCTPSLSASIFKLTDSVAQKNKQNSLKIFQILDQSGEDLVKVFFMLVRHFRILIQVQELVSKGEPSASITKKLNQHPFVIQKSREQSKNFSSKKLEEIYAKLLEIDLKMKTGSIKTYAGDNKEFALAIEQLIIDCCQK
ncbi:DNA polymerase III subunit delta [Candidatus Peregrinibacteria bacterium]|nr:DNA polymerase III subunit delta [Candidatus Peregrinibacteria bacterium]